MHTRAFNEMMEEAERRAKEAQREFYENGGMCLSCGQEPGSKDEMICPACKEDRDELIRQIEGAVLTL